MSQFRMVRSELYAEISWMDPVAKHIYLYLLIGPYSTSVSGLSRVSMNTVSEDTGYPIEWVSNGYRYLIDRVYLVYDDRIKLCFLRQEFEKFPPKSQKQIIGVLNTLERIPDCQVKLEVLKSIQPLINFKNKKLAERYQLMSDKVLMGIDTLSNGYRMGIHKDKDKDKEKYKEVDIISEKKTEPKKDVQKEEKNENKNPSPEAQEVPAELVKFSEVSLTKSHPEKRNKFSEETFPEKTKSPKENLPQRIREHYELLWRERMSSPQKPVENVESPGFSSVDYAKAKEILKRLNFDFNRVLELMRLYFSWTLPEVVNAGYPFSGGYASFHYKLTELMADKTNSLRRGEAAIAKNSLKKAETEATTEARHARILKMVEDKDGKPHIKTA